MTIFSLEQLLDLAEAEGRAKYAEGFRAGLAAADEANARTHEADAAAELQLDDGQFGNHLGAEAATKPTPDDGGATA